MELYLLGTFPVLRSISADRATAQMLLSRKENVPEPRWTVNLNAEGERR